MRTRVTVALTVMLGAMALTINLPMVPVSAAVKIHSEVYVALSYTISTPVSPQPPAPNVGTWFITTLAGGGNDGYPCWPEPYNWNNPIIPFVSAASKCSVRVWLHQFVYPTYIGNGWAFCVSPGAFSDIPSSYQYPLNIEITTVSSPC